MSIFVLVETSYPEPRVLAATRSLMAAQGAAQAHATEQGYGKIPIWHAPATEQLQWHGRGPDQSSTMYLIVELDGFTR